MSRESVSVMTFDVNSVCPLILQEKKSEQGFVYHEAPFNYKYARDGNVIVDHLNLVCGNMFFERGISLSKPMQDKPQSRLITINLNASTEGRALMQALDSLQELAAGLLFDSTPVLAATNKGKNKMPSKPRTREEWLDKDGLTEAYLTSEDGITKRKIVPLVEYKGVIKTKFRTVGRNEKGEMIFNDINPLLLIGRSVELIPTLHVKRTFISATLGNYKVQVFLASAIVGSVIENPMSGAELKAARELADMMGDAGMAARTKMLAQLEESGETANKPSSPKSLGDLPVADSEAPEWAAPKRPTTSTRKPQADTSSSARKAPEKAAETEDEQSDVAETPPPKPVVVRRAVRPPPRKVAASDEDSE